MWQEKTVIQMQQIQSVLLSVLSLVASTPNIWIQAVKDKYAPWTCFYFRNELKLIIFSKGFTFILLIYWISPAFFFGFISNLCIILQKITSWVSECNSSKAEATNQFKIFCDTLQTPEQSKPHKQLLVFSLFYGKCYVILLKVAYLLSVKSALYIFE